ncbi:D-alanyl-D-alanine carboxypeptidase [Candidatus Falkowbacteria bacterium]|nr:D-alanyl-D-alanine carboxypeptidase [Candidatus Falkowbacteria bacterium]
MLELILSLFLSSLLYGGHLPQVDGSFFVRWPVTSSQTGGDAVVGRLPSAAEKGRGPEKINPNNLGVEVSAAAGILVDWDSGKVLWQKNVSEQRSIASLTKLMTALVFLDNNPGWDAPVVIQAADQEEGGAATLPTGSALNVRDLFYATLVRSLNTGAAALARATGLTEQAFVEQMNAKGKALGMTNTRFVEPTGLHAGNVSTAEDLVLLVRTALDTAAIANATTMTQYSLVINGEERVLANTDWLLGGFLDRPPYQILGGKTGYIDNAGYCLAVVIQKGERRVISIMLGSSTIDSRFNDTKGIVDWAFRNYQWE